MNILDTTRILKDVDCKIDRRQMMKLLAFATGGASLAGAGWLTPGVARAADAVQRPIGDFLSAQGTTAQFFPPQPDQLVWTPSATDPEQFYAAVDYCGFADALLGGLLGTTTAGTVTERQLANGLAEVSVELHTKNALTWAAAVPTTFSNNNPLVYGYRVQDLLADIKANGRLTLTPALGESLLHVVFTNDRPGAKLPDLVAINLGNGTPMQQFLTVDFHAVAAGPARDLPGIPKGTLTRCTVTETGLIAVAIKNDGHGRVGLDAFPAEKIEFQPIGP